MIEKPDEDLFEGSKMTFGEHLEELRICLIRAALGVALGVIAGMLVANQVVVWVQGPVERALDAFYQEHTKTQLNALYGAAPKEMTDFLKEQRLTFEEIWIEQAELDRLSMLREAVGDSAIQSSDGVAGAAASDRDDGANLANDKTDAEGEDANGDQATTSLPAGSPGVPEAWQEPGPPSRDMFKARIWTRRQTQTRSLSMYEPFMIWLKASLVVGIAIASPWVFYQAWLFVSAGLYPHEKNYVYLYLPLSLTLFFSGAAFAFYFVFPPVLNFLLTFNSTLMIAPEPRINDWISFALFLPLGFGISFQLPIAMVFLERLGILSIETYTSNWRISILVIFFIAMMLTPADPTSMIMMAVPLTVLYFFGVGLCRWLPKRQSPFGQGYDPES